MISGKINLEKGQFSLQAEFLAPATGVCAVFGPSGSGKSTLLRSVAGLEKSARGNLVVNNKPWMTPEFCLAPHRRRVGMVFQEPSLLPHLSVRGNLEYARRRSGGIADNYRNIIELLGISQLMHRSASGLSGGESQRVALGRALLREPELLLLDEPLAALDLEARANLMTVLEGVLQHLDIPVLYVTHSPDEVARLADHLLLLEGGRVRACGPLAVLLANLDSPLARADDAFTVLRCRVIEPCLPGMLSLASRGGAVLHLPGVNRPLNSEVRLRVQARDVSLCLSRPDNSSIINILPAIVNSLSESGEGQQRTLRLNLAGESLLSRVSAYSCEQLRLHPGMQVFAQIKSVALIF